MGWFTASAQGIFNHPAENVYDFVSNPHNWKRTFAGSEGLDAQFDLPLKVGESWTELVKVGEDFACRSTWTLIVADRPRRWIFRQTDEIGQDADGSGGVSGFTTITYAFQTLPDGKTLFTRSLHCELPTGVRIPDQLLVARAQPANIDAYFAAIAAELDVAAGGAA